MAKITIKGKKLEFNPFDVKTMEIYNEKAKQIEEYSENSFSLEKSGAGLDAVVAMLKEVPGLLNGLIGELWGEKVQKELEGKIEGLNDCMTILDDINLMIANAYQSENAKRIEKYKANAEKYQKDVSNE